MCLLAAHIININIATGSNINLVCHALGRPRRADHINNLLTNARTHLLACVLAYLLT